MLLLKNANLYGEKIAHILIAQDKIEAIYDSYPSDLSIPNLEIRDLEESIVIPALIDQHVHVTGGGGEGGMTTRCPELEISDVIDAGVGTIVGLLGTDSLTRSVENLLAKTKSLREYGFLAYCLTGAYQYPVPTLTDSVMKDIAFIDEVIGVKIALNDHRSSHISYNEMKRLAADVRMAGLIGKKPGVVHVHMGNGKHGLSQIFDLIENENIPASVFRPTHMSNHMEAAKILTELGSYADFTTFEDSYKSAGIVDKALKTCIKDKVTMSSDSNGSMPKWNEKREMIGIGIGKMSTLFDTVKSLVNDYGYSLREALLPCGENVARSLNIFPMVGSLQENSLANLLVLDEKLNIKDFLLNGKYIKENYTNTMQVNFR